jgi:hypothetical protein
MTDFISQYLHVIEFVVPFAIKSTIFAVIMVKIICLSANMKLGDWPGQRLKFTAFGFSICLVAMGSFLIFLGGLTYTHQILSFGPNILTAGVAGVFVFDRRQFFNKHDKVKKIHGSSISEFQPARNDSESRCKKVESL